jgi:hypothetical protein
MLGSVLIVTGNFDEEGGRPSGIGTAICKFCEGLPGKRVNGGSLRELEELSEQAGGFKTVLWWPNVSNDYQEKLVDRIKGPGSMCRLLVSSKRNDGRYEARDIVAAALRTKSNLIVEINDIGYGKPLFQFGIRDPLGNSYGDYVELDTMLEALFGRLDFVSRLERARSVRVGDALPPYGLQAETFAVEARRWADLVGVAAAGSIVNADRFFGNAGFRCMAGFHGVRVEEGMTVFTTKRNVDKRLVGLEDFVACEARIVDGRVLYYGDAKPSVDAGILIKLFEMVEWANYAMHFHVYLKGVPFTEERLPCGSLEEAALVVRDGGWGQGELAVNLRGHGCMILSSTPIFAKRELVARPLWES